MQPPLLVAILFLYSALKDKKGTLTRGALFCLKPAVARHTVGDLVKDAVQHEHQLVVEIQPIDRLHGRKCRGGNTEQNAEQFYQE